MATLTINPFILSGHIPDEYFCDRKQERERLTQCMLNQENVVLISPRRMGKTQLIAHCFERPAVKQNLLTASIDILHTSSLRELTMQLGNCVFHTFAKKSTRAMQLFISTLKSLTASFGYDPVQNTPTFDLRLGEIHQPEYTLEEIFTFLDALGGRSVISIDEFQQIANYPEKNVEALLRSFVQKSEKVNFIFAGSQRSMLTEMFFAHSRPFYQSATLLQLGPIAETDYLAFASRQFAKSGKQLDEQAVHGVYGEFRGVTFYLQRVLHDAFALLPEGGTCDEAMITAVVNRYLDESGPRIAEQLSFVSEQQKELLYAICDEGEARQLTSSSFIRRHHLRSSSSVQSALRKLVDYDLVTRQDDCYQLSDPLMQLWIRRSILS